MGGAAAALRALSDAAVLDDRRCLELGQDFEIHVYEKINYRPFKDLRV